MTYKQFRDLVDEKGLESITFEDFPDLSKNDFEKFLEKYKNYLIKEDEEKEKELRKEEKEKKRQKRDLEAQLKREEKEKKRQERDLEAQLKREEKEKKQALKQAQEEEEQAMIDARREQYAGYMQNNKCFPIDIYENYCVFLEGLEDVEFSTNAISKKRYINNRELDETIYSDITREMNRSLRIGKMKEIARAVNALALKKLINPIADAISKGLWDGTKRAETFFIDFLGADNTELTKSLTMKWLYGTYKRLVEPGCKMDPMLIFVDPQQGTGKTNIMQRLGNCFHTDNEDYVYIQTGNITLRPDELRMLSSTWITVFDEMASMNKADNALVKSFVSHTTDTFRKPYDIDPKTYGRTCSFCGNSNSRYFLKDYTSNGCERRFWILPCNGQVRSAEEWNKILPDEYLRQLWYEVRDFYENNDNFEYNTLSLIEQDELATLQKEYKTSIDDLATERLDEILHRRYPQNIDRKIESNTIIDWLRDTYTEGYIGELEEIKIGTLRLVLNADRNGGGRGNEWIENIIENNYSHEYEIVKESTKGRPISILRKKHDGIEKELF